MKEIGEEFKEKREEIGITIEEVSTDLKIDSLLLENLEAGNAKVFKDVLEIKDIIEKYSKYLGIDSEKIIDEYNDYLFEKTSKISLDDIKNRIDKTKAEEKKIKSPYTIDTEEPEPKKNIIFITIILIIILLFLYFVLRQVIVG